MQGREREREKERERERESEADTHMYAGTSLSNGSRQTRTSVWENTVRA